jgi:hypothetical protein
VDCVVPVGNGDVLPSLIIYQWTIEKIIGKMTPFSPVHRVEATSPSLVWSDDCAITG